MKRFIVLVSALFCMSYAQDVAGSWTLTAVDVYYYNFARPADLQNPSEGSVNGWQKAACIVIAGTGLGQIRTVTSSTSNNESYVEVDFPFSTSLDSSSVVTVAPWVGLWLVAGNQFANGTSVQTYGMTLKVWVLVFILE